MRPVLAYGAQMWVICKNEGRILEIKEMKMLRCIAGVSFIERSQNEDIRTEMDMSCITGKLRKIRLRWLELMDREDGIARLWRGLQRLRIRDVVRRDTEVTEVVKGTTHVKTERHGEERHGGGRGCGGYTKIKTERRSEERHGGDRGCGGDTKIKNERRSEERHGGGRGCGGDTKVKNERRGEERHGDGRGCGGDDKG